MAFASAARHPPQAATLPSSAQRSHALTAVDWVCPQLWSGFPLTGRKKKPAIPNFGGDCVLSWCKGIYECV